MKTQLILLDTPIIVSDEKIKESEWCLNPNGHPDIFGYDYRAIFSKEKIDNCKKIIAGLPGLPQIDFNGFEEQLGIVNAEQLALAKYPKHTFVDNEFGDDLSPLCRIGFEEGFKTSQKLNERKFSLADMHKIFAHGYKGHNTSKNLIEYRDELIENLSQPKVFDIEIECEIMWFNSRFGGTWQPFPDEKTTISKKEPKITNNSIKILNVINSL